MNPAPDVAAHGEAQTRFAFGANWQRFLDELDDVRIRDAEGSLKTMLGVDDLSGQRFLDAGCGSGLFSLAARRLGARVYSFDFDGQSVACAAHLKTRYFAGDTEWTIEAGDVLDKGTMRGLGSFDVVYSWGVLHHTGAMWRALDNAAGMVAPGGLLFVALYNDQGWISRYWAAVKRVYQRGGIARGAMIAIHWPYLIGARRIVVWRAGRGRCRAVCRCGPTSSTGWAAGRSRWRARPPLRRMSAPRASSPPAQ